MKKIVIWSLNLTLATFLFSSCSQKLALTKRHYNNGYYVESKKHVTSEGIAINQKTVAKNKFELKKKFDNDHVSVKPILTHVKSTKSSIATIGKEMYPSEKILYSTANSSFLKNNFVVQSPNQLKYKSINIDFRKDSLGTSKDDTESGLSLFWIVILILLLLWLFGFVLLSGGLINLVLALALVLLILWLLRII